MSAEAWLSIPSEMPESTETAPATSADAPSDALLTPRPLEEGERIELWLAGQGTDTRPSTDGEDAETDVDGWDVRPAQGSAVALPFIAVAVGGWGLSSVPRATRAPGARAVLRRLGGEGIAEWEGTIATGAEPVPQPDETAQLDTNGAAHSRRRATIGIAGVGDAGTRAAEAILVVRLTAPAGAVHQRRRSP